MQEHLYAVATWHPRRIMVHTILPVSSAPTWWDTATRRPALSKILQMTFPNSDFSMASSGTAAQYDMDLLLACATCARAVCANTHSSPEVVGGHVRLLEQEARRLLQELACKTREGNLVASRTEPT